MYKIGSMPHSIPIGYTGETNFRVIEIDMTAWMEKMPAGVPSIVHIRPGETKAQAYIAATTFDSETNILTWEITAGDIGTKEGNGLMQVWLEESENDTVSKRGKSVKVTTEVMDSVNEPDDEPPEAQAAYLEQMTELKVATVEAAEDAEDAKEDAVDAAEQAQQAATDAENVNLHPAYIDSTTKHWMVYDATEHQYTDTEILAEGQDGQDGQDATPDLVTNDYSDLTFPVTKDTLCYHSGLLYYAKQDISTSEEWTAAHWQQTTLEELLSLQKTAIQGMEGKLLRSDLLLNLYEEQSISDIQDQYILQNGVPKSASWSVYYYVSDYVAVTGGKTIKFNFAPWGAADSSLRAAEYDSNKTYIKNITSTEHELSANCAYIRFSVKKNDFGSQVGAVLDFMNKNLLITDGTKQTGGTSIDEETNTFMSETGVRKEDTYFVDSSTAILLILWKMPGINGKDVGVKFQAGDNNAAYNIKSIGTVENDLNFVGNEPENYVEYMASNEDWFSPMKVNAVNNIDGDSPDTLKWSGGMHRSNGVDTARRTKLEILFDGRKNPGFVGYCKTIDIIVVHRNVASNTFKADGTGREVVEETIRTHFEGGIISVETTVKALEEVNVYVWYFMQAHHKPTGLGSSGIRYIGGDANRGITSMDGNSNSGDLYARVMRLLSDTVQLDMEIDNFDVGRFNHVSQSYGEFVEYYSTYSKAYFNVINNTSTPLHLDAGDSFTARGSYKFGIFE